MTTTTSTSNRACHLNRPHPALRFPKASRRLLYPPRREWDWIDSGVDLTHPAFQAVKILSHGCSGKSVPDTHGTAVASLMVGQAGNFRGAAVGATLFAADVYCGVPSGGAVDAIVSALAWMARERVAVVNVSLVGPPNALLENRNSHSGCSRSLARVRGGQRWSRGETSLPCRVPRCCGRDCGGCEAARSDGGMPRTTSGSRCSRGRYRRRSAGRHVRQAARYLVRCPHRFQSAGIASGGSRQRWSGASAAPANGRCSGSGQPGPRQYVWRWPGR